MPDILTREQVREIGERAAKATEGPWVKYGMGGITSSEWDIAWEGHGYCQHCGEEVSQQPFIEGKDAEFCAHARQDIPALCATVEALREENERLRGLLREWTDMDPLRYDSEYSCCPWCNFDYSNMKHEPDCPFVLARTECGISSAPGS